MAVSTSDPSTEATIWKALLTSAVLVVLSLTDASGGLSRSGKEASRGSDACVVCVGDDRIVSGCENELTCTFVC